MTISTLPAAFASIVRAFFTSGTMPSAVMSSVGGIVINRPSSVVNWLLSESLPETNGVR